MTSRAAVEEALRSAASGAHVDRDAPAGEQVSFERGALDRVVRLFRETGGEDRVISAWNQVLREFITAGARRARAALLLPVTSTQRWRCSR